MKLPPSHRYNNPFQLSIRELQIAEIISSTGVTDKEVGRQLDLTENTVRTYLKTLYSKTELNRATLWKLFEIDGYPRSL